MGDKPLTFTASIKVGAVVGQDFRSFRWPRVMKQLRDPHMTFQVEDRGNYFDCRAAGFGGRDDYGNGSVNVGSINSLIVSEEDLRRVVNRKRAEKLVQISVAQMDLAKLVDELKALEDTSNG